MPPLAATLSRVALEAEARPLELPEEAERPEEEREALDPPTCPPERVAADPPGRAEDFFAAPFFAAPPLEAAVLAGAFFVAVERDEEALEAVLEPPFEAVFEVAPARPLDAAPPVF